jgi:hypothetical protein
MFNTNADKPPKRPLVPSQLAALTEVTHWLKENQFDTLTDADGLTWRLNTKVVQLPEAGNPKGLIWQLRLTLTVSATAAELIKTGTLAATDDARLIGLIGAEPVVMAMKPNVYTSKDEDGLKAILIEVLPKLREKIAKSHLHEVKRGLIGRFIEGRSIFGAR